MWPAIRPRSGGVAEGLKAHAWKACLRETVTWVRIPLPPPNLIDLVIFLRILLFNPQIDPHTEREKMLYNLPNGFGGPFKSGLGFHLIAGRLSDDETEHG